IIVTDGMIYASSPDNVWAIDARDGTVHWHYYWKTRGGTSLQTRGLGMWHNYLYFELHDDWVVCLDAKTGKEIWKKEIASFDAQYFSSNAPMILGNHVIVGTGNDMDSPGYIKSFDPENGALQWTFYTVPMKPGDPGADTWASIDAARHGGGMTWIPGSYDPETHYYIFGTGNPTPAYTTGRGEGDNLFTGALLAVNVDNRKPAWCYQTAPHDTPQWELTRNADSRRHAVQRTAAQAGDDGDAQRLLLRARSHDGGASCDQQARFGEQLGQRLRCEGPAEAQSEQGCDHFGRAGERRRQQLS